MSPAMPSEGALLANTTRVGRAVNCYSFNDSYRRWAARGSLVTFQSLPGVSPSSLTSTLVSKLRRIPRVTSLEEHFSMQPYRSDTRGKDLDERRCIKVANLWNSFCELRMVRVVSSLPLVQVKQNSTPRMSSAGSANGKFSDH